MPDRIRHVHAVLAQQAESGIERRVGRGQHAAVAGREELARVKRKAGDVAVRTTHPLPQPVRAANLAAGGAGRILDHAEAMPRGQACDGGQVTRHPQLVHAEDGPRGGRDGGFHLPWVDVERVRVNIDEHRRGAAVPDGVGGGDVRVADGDDLVAGPHAKRRQGHMQRRRAARHRAGVRRTHLVREFALEGGHLGTLRDPARQDGPPRRGCLLFAHPGLCNRNHERGSQFRTTSASSSVRGSPPCSRYQASRRARPSSSPTAG